MRLRGAKVHLSLHQYRQHRGVSRRFSYISYAVSNKQASLGRLCMRPWPDRDDARGGGLSWIGLQLRLVYLHLHETMTP